MTLRIRTSLCGNIVCTLEHSLISAIKMASFHCHNLFGRFIGGKFCAEGLVVRPVGWDAACADVVDCGGGFVKGPVEREEADGSGKLGRGFEKGLVVLAEVVGCYWGGTGTVYQRAFGLGYAT
ncbi:uncharacterized protein LACBIDRAFT_313610 [Laccaria bicolor S238N-H82]|uniref:Predicted protein n=1 Tax=Laccaria bicolor (strain S238N-H82 / ATCC MYA-4686) TaxID=486041 RepID=B0D0E2_LACBS|nr:uncharacterized protein LACBIDRAFT_313610 [Laccaria bicolor S238N-H82]EDR11812.1 predicted protein [Laccaria bicolor S238N-H82]|eukprot:XP_001877709.1 predicted protein [Laccaria bicolor S238N-H82]